MTQVLSLTMYRADSAPVENDMSIALKSDTTGPLGTGAYGIDLANLENVLQGYQQFGKGNKESLAELFVALLAKLSSVETMWQYGLCVSTYTGSWISKTWESEIANMSKFRISGDYASMNETIRYKVRRWIRQQQREPKQRFLATVVSMDFERDFEDLKSVDTFSKMSAEGIKG
ncbi:hypothetical protein ACLOJK_041489 [Asimina triloba]